MKKLEIVKTEARKIHIKKALLDLNFRYMNIISLVAFIAMVYGIIRNQNVISDDTASESTGNFAFGKEQGIDKGTAF